MRALVTGATGFVGQRLLERLVRPVVLSRDPDRAMQTLSRFKITAVGWDPSAGEPPPRAFDGVDAVFHLAGESVAAGRWTKARKQGICDSRLFGTKHLVDALAKLDRRPGVLVSASAVGYYGSRGDEVLTETSPSGDDFLAEVCVAWEKAAFEAERTGIRVVTSRTGVVLGRGGALAKMLPPFKLGLGGRLGNGRQWMPWIHLDDLVGLLLFAAEQEAIRGPMNAVGPTPVTNRDFTRSLARRAPSSGDFSRSVFRAAAAVRRVRLGAVRLAAGAAGRGHAARLQIPAPRSRRRAGGDIQDGRDTEIGGRS